MANKNKQEQDQELKAIEGALTSSEAFFEKNQKPLIITLVAIIVIAAVWLLVKNLYIDPRESEAEAVMSVGQTYFQNGDYRTALDGDSIDFPGFIAVGEDYPLTKSANLAKVYSGLSFFKLGEYENAISYLEQTSLSDDIMQYTVQGTIGDCYVQLGDSVEAVKYFINAAKSKNILVRPVYLVKAGLCYEAAGNYAKALEMYETVKNGKLEAQSGIPEVDNIDKYIARAAAHVE